MAKKTLSGHAPKRIPGRTRGLDRARYLVLLRMVEAGDTTWEELEAKGLALPPARESDFRRDVRKALKK
jgi:hypothetical protein